jgi:SOS response regulatory protein OraA/RecX
VPSTHSAAATARTRRSSRDRRPATRSRRCRKGTRASRSFPLTRKEPAAEPLLRQKLAARGIDEATAGAAVQETLDGVDLEAAAEAAARRRLTTLARLTPEAALRRTAAALARRGFDEDLVASVVERLAREADVDTP